MTDEKERAKDGAGVASVFCYAYVKRALDVFFAYMILLVAYIPMLFIALAIKLTSQGSVIFRQVRIGAGGRRFVCYKFRTMREDAPTNLSTAEFADADAYVTSVGRFLRRTSLDELPQLFNVLGGDMSLVGPRPLIPEEKEVHRQRRELGVYAVRPGITGLAQVMGRDMLTDEEKVGYDTEYATEIDFALDVRIILSTFGKVLSADGVGKKAERKRSRSHRKT